MIQAWRKLAEEALVTTEQYFRALVLASAEIVWSWPGAKARLTALKHSFVPLH